MSAAAVPDLGKPSKAKPTRNLNGQRLGRKGLITREKLIRATNEILLEQSGSALSLKLVAARAGVSMSLLYLYFKDLTELVIAVLEPIMVQLDETVLAQLRNRWPDEELGERCLTFIEALHRFWDQYSEILHMRNQLADRHDLRMFDYRMECADPFIDALIGQMDRSPGNADRSARAMATVLYTGIERTVTMLTDHSLDTLMQERRWSPTSEMLTAEAFLIEEGIRKIRATGSPAW